MIEVSRGSIFCRMNTTFGEGKTSAQTELAILDSDWRSCEGETNTESRESEMGKGVGF